MVCCGCCGMIAGIILGIIIIFSGMYIFYDTDTIRDEIINIFEFSEIFNIFQERCWRKIDWKQKKIKF